MSSVLRTNADAGLEDDGFGDLAKRIAARDAVAASRLAFATSTTPRPAAVRGLDREGVAGDRETESSRFGTERLDTVPVFRTGALGGTCLAAISAIARASSNSGTSTATTSTGVTCLDDVPTPPGDSGSAATRSASTTRAASLRSAADCGLL
jgi:hypothetical protein